MIRVKPKIKYLVLIILFLFIIISFLGREVIFYQIGRFLLKDMEIEKADTIVALRGDSNYSRILEAGELFKKDYGDNIIISVALRDGYSKKLKEYGVDIATEQQRLLSILMQLGIPEEKIILDNQLTGGGTLGELKRIRKIIKEKEYKKVIIVTSWWHTKRTYLMAKRVFKNDNLNFFVAASKSNISTSSNWWQYRYEAIYVLEEFPKLFFFYLNRIFGITFNDDPALN